MNYKVLPKTEKIPVYDSAALEVQFIDNGEAVTEASVAALLEQIPKGIAVCLFLDPDGEESFMEVLSDGKWLALGCSYDFGTENYYSYNAEYGVSEEYTPLKSGGQSPVKKAFALTDFETGKEAVAYFIHTGKRYPGIDWAKQL